VRTLRAGPLTATLDGVNLRWIRYGSHEVLRHVYIAVRDPYWGTLANEVQSLDIDDHGDSFSIRCSVVNREGPVHFRWAARIDGGADGTIRWTMSGQALSTFLKNRIGFCVLHPIAECAGKACQVEHTGGSIAAGRFPLHVSPHQPFLDMRSIAHRLPNGVLANVSFSGDVFEMEDHRNWSDASYKTYSTPLALPYPVQIEAGTRIEQSVTLTVSGTPLPRISLGESRYPLPEIGTALPATRVLTAAETELVRDLGLNHLRVDLHLSRPDWRTALSRASEAGIPLECAVFVTDAADSELSRLAQAMSSSATSIRRWLILHELEAATNAKWIEAARAHLGPVAPGAEFCGGTNWFFAELNRNRPDFGPMDGVCYPLTPQVHGFDDATIIENVACHGDLVRSARQFAPGKRVVVSPVTLRWRFHPAAPGHPEAEPDPRQSSGLCAAWMVVSLKHLASAGAASVTYFEAAGPKGLLEGGMLFPAFEALRWVKGASCAVESFSTDPLRVDALALEVDGRIRLLAANFSATEEHVMAGAEDRLHTLPPRSVTCIETV